MLYGPEGEEGGAPLAVVVVEVHRRLDIGRTTCIIDGEARECFLLELCGFGAKAAEVGGDAGDGERDIRQARSLEG